MAEKKIIEIQVKTDQAIQSVDKLSDSFDKVDDSASKASDSIDEVSSNGGAIAILDQVTGGLASQLKNAWEAARLFNGQLRLSRAALISTGIGAFVVALGAVVAYWDDIVAWIDKSNISLENHKKILNERNGILDSTNKLLEAEIKLAKLRGENVDKYLKKNKEVIDEQIKNQEEYISKILAQIKATKDALDKAQKPATTIGGSLVKAFQSTGVKEYNTAMDDLTSKLREAQTELANLKSASEEAGKAIEDAAFAEADAQAAVVVTGTKNKGVDPVKNKTDETNKIIESEEAKNAALESIRLALIDTEAEQRAERLRQIQSDYDAQIALAQQYYGVASLEVLALREAQQNALNEQQAIFDQQDQDRKDAKNATEIANEQAQADALDKIEADKRAAQMQTLDQAIAIANEESALGKALLVAKQILAAKEAIIDAKATASKAAQAVADAGVKAAGAGVDISTGAAKAASAAPPPLNVPLIIAYAAQAVGIIASIRAATSKMKSAVPSGGGISIGAPSIPQATVPQVNTVGSSGVNQLASVVESSMNRPIKAFVVSKDVSTAQEMDRNIISQAGI